ncbi:MAG: helix-turn-helix domain-containing protein [Alphaproteobacteria bacterium]
METKESQETLFLTVREAANELRVCRRQIYNLIDAGTITSVKLGRNRRIPTSCIKALAAPCAASATAA